MATFGALGGGNVPVTYKIIATSAANQTYAAQLTILKSTWNSISNNDKITKQFRIVRDGHVGYYPSRDLLGNFVLINSNSTGIAIVTLDINDCTGYDVSCVASTNSITSTNITSSTTSTTMQLQMYVD